MNEEIVDQEEIISIGGSSESDEDENGEEGENLNDEESENYLNNIFRCPICFHTMKSPRFLVCGHGFCMDCIGEFFLFEKQRNSKEPRNCPVCRDDTSRKFTRVPVVEECLDSIRGFVKTKNMKQLKFGKSFRAQQKIIKAHRNTILKMQKETQELEAKIKLLESHIGNQTQQHVASLQRIEILESHIKSGALILGEKGDRYPKRRRQEPDAYM